ncbi:MAG: hypothetical protein ACE148_16070 [Vicinamibacterales bacterium]
MAVPVVAQALIERGLLDSVAAGIRGAAYRLDELVGPGNSKWVFIGAAALFLFFLFRRPR